MEFLKISLILLITFSINANKDVHPTEVIDLIDKPKKSDLLFNNELDNLIAPFTNQSSIFMLTGATAGYIVYKDDFEEKRNNRWRRKEKKKLWRSIGDTLGWGLLPVGYAIGMGLYGNSLENKDGQSKVYRDIEYVAKSVVYTSLATFALKLTVDQRRPKDRLKKDSFPSGHASSSFAFSTAIWLVHGPYAGAAATAVASWVAYSRIDDGSHYYHDSIVGAVLGMSYAWGIYNNHYRRKLPFQFTFQPKYNGNKLDGLHGTITYSY